MRSSNVAGRATALPVLGLGLALAGCGGHPHAGSSPSPRPPAPAATRTLVPIHVETSGGNGEYVRIVETVRGRKVYTIRALSGDMVRGGTSAAVGDLVQPHVTFVDKSGTTTIADAPKARITEQDNSVTMMGGVHAHTSSGSLLSCDVLTYNGNTQRFTGEGHVQLSAPNGLVMDGRHLDGDVKLQDVNVTGSPE
jgi:LPS export ABC transporter protein LptC